MSRLTKKENGMYLHTHTDEDRLFVVYDLCNKLGQLEDLMEKYEINDLVDLEMALDYYYHRFDNVQTRRKDNE